MKTLKFLITNLFLLIAMSAYCQKAITPDDLKIIVGNWEGSITYLDYQTNKPFTMPANLTVEQGGNENSLVLNNIYPNEPKANSSDKIKVTKNGTLLNKNSVTLREELENGSIQIQTEHEGKDDNKKALIRYTYILGEDTFVIRKQVQFGSDSEWIKRSEYNYNKEG